ncbi:hypothetical protein HZS_4237 [Henneguya salminicola]|nr:hypothetical protein HZS_4237 [Henneguya salminicola]
MVIETFTVFQTRFPKYDRSINFFLFPLFPRELSFPTIPMYFRASEQTSLKKMHKSTIVVDMSTSVSKGRGLLIFLLTRNMWLSKLAIIHQSHLNEIECLYVFVEHLNL